MAIAFDVANGQKVGSGTTNTFSHTVTSLQSNEIILVAVDSGVVVTGVMYAGVSLTSLGSITQPGGDIISLWYLLAPASGSPQNVIVTCGSTTFIIAESASYYNVAQSSTFGTVATNASVNPGNTSSTITVTTTNSNQVVVDAVNNQAAQTDTPNAGQNKRFQPATSGGALGDIAATGGNMTLGWSWTSQANWGEIAVAMNSAPTVQGPPLMNVIPSQGIGYITGALFK